MKNGNSSTINATDYINEDDEEEDVNAVRFQNNYRGNNRGYNYNNRGNRGGANFQNPNSNRGGQQTSQYRGNPSRGGVPNRGYRGGSTQGSSTQQYSQAQNNVTNQQGQKPKDVCRYCKKPGHTIEDCWTLQAKNKARGVSQVDQSQVEDEVFEDNADQISQVSSIFN